MSSERYEKVIVRIPGDSFPTGLTHGRLGRADAELARIQHQAYIETLLSCGVNVDILEPDEAHADSVFMEDSAIVTTRMAVVPSMCRPGRQGEEVNSREALSAYYGSRFERIQLPATLEGGDVIRVGNHFLIGKSFRSSDDGAQQLADILTRYGYTSDFISIREAPHVLHLTTGMCCLGDGIILTRPEFAAAPAIQKYRVLVTPPEEAYAANAVRMNDYVLMADGFEKTIRMVEDCGYRVIRIPMSEFEKQDGGLSCLSLRLLPREF